MEINLNKTWRKVKEFKIEILMYFLMNHFTDEGKMDCWIMIHGKFLAAQMMILCVKEFLVLEPRAVLRISPIIEWSTYPLK